MRVIAPSRSLSLPWINADLKARAVERLQNLGLVVSFGQHVYEMDDFQSSAIASRLSDLHDAFTDPSIHLIITVIGGHNVNQLLDAIDYDLIKRNPKILCGYSDITALSHAIYAKTGLVTYSGPHFISFGDKRNFDYTGQYFQKCLFSVDPFRVRNCPEITSHFTKADRTIPKSVVRYPAAKGRSYK